MLSQWLSCVPVSAFLSAAHMISNPVGVGSLLFHKKGDGSLRPLLGSYVSFSTAFPATKPVHQAICRLKPPV